MSDNLSNSKTKIRLEMLSDWHIGTGAGIPGSVDALLARDGDRFPCVPAKTIVGIWRDAMETLTLGLDNGDAANKVWQKWVDVIFGSQPNIDKIPTDKPRPSILSIEPARLDENLRDAIGNDEQMRQALTFIKPNTAVESESGTAKTDSLRFTEMGRIGTVLETEVKLDLDALENASPEKKELIEALLVASAALVERIGGNRRRGSGKCEIQIPKLMSKEKAVGVLRAANMEDIKSTPTISTDTFVSASLALTDAVSVSEPPAVEDIEPILSGVTDESSMSEPPAVAGGSDSNKDDLVTSDTPNNETLDATESPASIEWKRIKYSLKLHTPVAIVTNTLGNVSETLDFIPGTYLLPYITKQLKGITKDVASGDFQVSPATIEIKVPKKNDKGEVLLEENRGLPVPKVIFYHKVDGGFDKTIKGGFDKKQEGEKPTVYNLIREPEKVEDLTHQKKNYREGYVNSIDENGTLPLYETTKKILLMHNTVRDDIQRPDETVGGVFSRQAIKAGTTLRGEIRLKASIAEELSKQDEKWVQKLNDYVRIGTSKKDDYGLAELTFEELKEDTSNATTANELIVYLESDVLLRNSNLRQTNLVEDLKTFLEKKLSVTLTEKDSLIQVRRIESWHEGWGFPRPTLMAMAAGSVVAFEVIGTIDTRTLQNLELSGIGERRGEGYGRIRFNPPLLMDKINSWTVPTKTKPTSNGNSEALTKLKAEIHNAEKLKEFISIIELAAWRDELARAVLKLANEPQKRKEIFGFQIQGKESIPSLSQIGSLRSVIVRLKLDGTNKNIVTDWLKHLKATSNRADKWKGEFGQIENLFADGKENLIWEKLSDFWRLPKALISDETTLKNQLWTEAVKSLFDACARAHKRDTED